VQAASADKEPIARPDWSSVLLCMVVPYRFCAAK